MRSLRLPRRVALARLPTPIVKLERLSARMGVEIFVKRDDLTGLLETGNKIRKLEFLVGDALDQGADTLISWGPPGSNCCRALAAVAARLGLRAVLAVLGPEPEIYDGNLLLVRLLGAEIAYVTEEEFRAIDAVIERLVVDVRRRGGHPYVIPMSGANELGALGYLECGREISGQIGAGTPALDTLMIAAWSGTSQAGLIMARQVAGLSAKVVGVSVAYDAGRVKDTVRTTIARVASRFDLAVDPPKAVHILNGYSRPPGASLPEEELAMIIQLAREEGILLDPVYTGKAFLECLAHLALDPKAFGSRVCFIHTGGLFSLFPFRAEFSRLLENQPNARSARGATEMLGTAQKRSPPAFTSWISRGWMTSSHRA